MHTLTLRTNTIERVASGCFNRCTSNGFYVPGHRRGNTTDEFFCAHCGRIGRNLHRIFQQTLGKVLIASPSRVAEKSRVCLRQRVCQQYVRYPERSPYPAYGLLREDQRFNRAAIEVLFFYVLQQRPVVATTMS